MSNNSRSNTWSWRILIIWALVIVYVCINVIELKFHKAGFTHSPQVVIGVDRESDTISIIDLSLSSANTNLGSESGSLVKKGMFTNTEVATILNSCGQLSSELYTIEQFEGSFQAGPKKIYSTTLKVTVKVQSVCFPGKKINQTTIDNLYPTYTRLARKIQGILAERTGDLVIMATPSKRQNSSH